MVCSPLRLLDCCPQTDGAAAILLTSAERAHEFTDKPVYVAGFGVATDHPYLHEKSTLRRPARHHARRRGAPTRWPASAPRDIDMAEVHDCFTITEILDIEDLGLRREGQGRARLARRRDRPRRPHPGQPLGRPAGQGPSHRRHRHRPAHRVLVAAARGGRRAARSPSATGFALQHNVGGRGSGVSVVNILTNRA